ncbi:MAG TPA: Rne/Rng family ribonuclease, partial [Anaeromyxobacter sp.]|nr:Rne/Rng family ribonuclease [Anaeromyxobacter sp.]
ADAAGESTAPGVRAGGEQQAAAVGATALDDTTGNASSPAVPAEAAPAPAALPESGQVVAKPEGAAREARQPREEREGRGDRDRERGRREGREERRRERDGREAKDRDGKDRDGKERDGKERRNGRHGDERKKEQKNIQDLLKEGQEVIVQVAKDPIGTKGARITSHISLPGRHLVFMPTVDHVGISRRIEKDGERRRLREIVDRMRPEGTGFIVRTVAENVEAGKLEADIRFLIQVWNEIIRTKDKVSAPALLHPDLDLILRATRDLFTADVQKLVIDDRDEHERILRFVSEQAPHLAQAIELYSGQEPIFDAYGIEQELKRASQRKVWLKSGGYIIMDQAEALTAIDVNSGRYVGKKNLEETITKINVEAAKEIVYQLRLRNIGGIIIIDFIDMDKPQNRDKVFKALQDALGRDKAKTNVLKISELGLVEMTRKRVRESVTRVMNEPCGYCDGRGHVKSKTTVAYEIFREIRRDAPHFGEPVLVVNCHPDVARILQGQERDELRYLMDRFNKTIQVKPQGGYHQEQFDIYGRQDRQERGQGERAERQDRQERAAQPERAERGDRQERGERPDRDDRRGRGGGSQRGGGGRPQQQQQQRDARQGDRGGRGGDRQGDRDRQQGDRAQGSDKERERSPDRERERTGDRGERAQRGERADRPDRPERGDRPERADRGERAERSDSTPPATAPDAPPADRE